MDVFAAMFKHNMRCELSIHEELDPTFPVFLTPLYTNTGCIYLFQFVQINFGMRVFWAFATTVQIQHEMRAQ